MKLSIKEMCIFSMFASLMYASKIIMEAFPNIHILGALIMSITLVYRKKALVPIYLYALIQGLFSGFSSWWIPYLYIWTILWAMTMCIPKNLPNKYRPIVYMIVCACHGFLYGTFYAPAQAIMFQLDFNQTIAWIIAGLPWDMIHGISNFFMGSLIYPLVKVMNKIK